MTLGAPSPRPICAHCGDNDHGPLATKVLRARAAEYASALVDGSTIDDDPGGIDHAYVAPFRAYLAEALYDAGFSMAVTYDRDTKRLVTTVSRRRDAE